MTRLAAALPDDGAGDARRALAHALVADRIWLLRLRGEPTEGVALWPDLDAAGCRALARRNGDAYALYLAELKGLDASIAYTTLSGTHAENTIGDALEHVLLHAAHHRGQANAALRAAGHEPPTLDFIAWIRAGEPPADL